MLEGRDKHLPLVSQSKNNSRMTYLSGIAKEVSGFPGGSVVKNLPANARDARDVGLIPGSGRSPREGNGNPLQYSCLKNSMDREAGQATVHEVAELDTTEQLSRHPGRSLQQLLRISKCQHLRMQESSAIIVTYVSIHFWSSFSHFPLFFVFLYNSA